MVSDILILTSAQFKQDTEVKFLMQRIRTIRDAELKATDFWGLSDFTMTPAQIKYRADLRDLPNVITPSVDADGFLIMTDFPTYVG